MTHVPRVYFPGRLSCPSFMSIMSFISIIRQKIKQISKEAVYQLKAKKSKKSVHMAERNRSVYYSTCGRPQESGTSPLPSTQKPSATICWKIDQNLAPVPSSLGMS